MIITFKIFFCSRKNTFSHETLALSGMINEIRAKADRCNDFKERGRHMRKRKRKKFGFLETCELRKLREEERGDVQ